MGAYLLLSFECKQLKCVQSQNSRKLLFSIRVSLGQVCKIKTRQLLHQYVLLEEKEKVIPENTQLLMQKKSFSNT